MGFRDGELVIYKTDGQTAVGGLSTDSQYFASVQDGYKVKLHKTYDDAISASNAIDLTGFGQEIIVLGVQIQKMYFPLFL